MLLRERNDEKEKKGNYKNSTGIFFGGLPRDPGQRFLDTEQLNTVIGRSIKDNIESALPELKASFDCYHCSFFPPSA